MFPGCGCVLLLAWSPPGFDAVCVASANTRQGELCVESVDTAPHLTTRRSCIRFTMPDPAPGPAAVLCPLSSLHPASPD